MHAAVATYHNLLALLDELANALEDVRVREPKRLDVHAARELLVANFQYAG